MADQDLSVQMDEHSRIKQELADLRKRMPAHSIKPEFIRKLEDLEEQLEKLGEELDGA